MLKVQRNFNYLKDRIIYVYWKIIILIVHFCRSCSIKYSLLATSSVTGVTVRSVLNVMQGHLPYRVWLPYDYSTSPMFWITSVQQIITVIFVTIINVGTETLVFGLFLQTCAQFEIFESRLRKLVFNKTNKLMKNKIRYLEHSSPSPNKGKAIISKYVYHHLKIYKLELFFFCTHFHIVVYIF